jgi:hypothetical protein
VRYSLAEEALADFAMRRGIPVAETIAGKASLSHDHLARRAWSAFSGERRQPSRRQGRCHPGRRPETFGVSPGL